MRSMKSRLLTVAGIFCGLLAMAAQASVTISGTRVVYPAQDREVSVRLNNTGERPTLIQAWLDKGNPAAAPNEIKVPFVLLPAVFRVEPHRGQAMRIMFTGGEMPTDRESVYWLNVLEIPPKPADTADRNMIQLAFRTRIKMFYRPSTLTDDPSAERAKLKWGVVTNAKNQRLLRLENTSPYYISIGQVALKSGATTVVFQPDMAPPFGHVDLAPATGQLGPHAAGTLAYTILNDFGAGIAASAQLDGASQASTDDNR